MSKLKYVNVDVPSYYADSSQVKIETMCLNFDQGTQSYSTAREAVEGKGTLIRAPQVLTLVVAIAVAVLMMLF